MFKIGCEEARGPDFSVTGHDISGPLRRRSGSRSAREKLLDVPGVFAPLVEEKNAGVTRNKIASGFRVAISDLVELGAILPVVPHREADEVEQRVGDAPHGRDHDTQTSIGLVCNYVGDAPETGGIGKAATAEFMNFPMSFGQELRPAHAQSG
jgi:hypothetical protein